MTDSNILNLSSELIKIIIGSSPGVVPSLLIDKINTTSNKEISLSELRKQIAVAQELAIARRIETADEVEIEEYYDNSIDGHVGAKAIDNGISLGIGGSGNCVSKRVYKFKGYNDKRIEAYEQTRDKVFKIDVKENNKDDK